MSFSDMLGAAGKVFSAFEDGYRVGHEINEHVAQPLFDEHHAGSGPLGESYIHFVDKHGDPAPAVELVQHVLDSLILHQDHHSHQDHSSVYDHTPAVGHDSHDFGIGIDHFSGGDHHFS